MGGTPSANTPGGIVGGSPTMSGGDMALAALSSIGNKQGIIPALVSGLGSMYLANKQNQAANAAAIQQEQSRRGGQSALAQMAGIDPKYLDGMSAADKETFKQYLDQQQAMSSRNYSNKILPSVGAPTMDGIPSDAYQQSVLNNLFSLTEKRPGMRQTDLENQLKEGTLQSAIQGTNATNQAAAKYAVPMAGANYQGKTLDNTGQAIENKYAPQKNQMDINKGQSEINKNNMAAQELAGMNAFQSVLDRIDKENPNPQEFRHMAIETLKGSPVSAKGLNAAMQDIENMTLMKMELLKRPQQQPQQQGQPQQGGLGINWQ